MNRNFDFDVTNSVISGNGLGIDLIERLKLGAAPVSDVATIALQDGCENRFLVILSLGFGGRRIDPFSNTAKDFKVHVHPIAIDGSQLLADSDSPFLTSIGTFPHNTRVASAEKRREGLDSKW